MDRRESIKSLLVGSIAGGSLLLESCAPNSEAIIKKNIWDYKYGRTPKEAAFDEKLLQEKFFDDSELNLIVVLANLILPPTKKGTIEQAGVPEFIEFMMKDVPEFQTKIRGGLMWLNSYSNQNFKKRFANVCHLSLRHSRPSIFVITLDLVKRRKRGKQIAPETPRSKILSTRL